MNAITELSNERRMHPRFQSKGCMFTANSKFGRVIDLSLGGVAFYYADRAPWADEAFDSGALVSEDQQMVANLPVQTVTDHEIPNNYSPGAITIRRRAIRFAELSPEQEKELTYFIALISIG
ncbi:MAG: hypothetical protein OEV91_08055 [Desulfobulbaceae bacterium]|nr:hypothetical protein [Desulfobulbaceae bacterium]